MNLKASEIHLHFMDQGLILGHLGPDNAISRFAPIDDCAPGDLVFIDNPKYLGLLRERKPEEKEEKKAAPKKGQKDNGKSPRAPARPRIRAAKQEQA